jgi:hypothetical protein
MGLLSEKEGDRSTIQASDRVFPACVIGSERKTGPTLAEADGVSASLPQQQARLTNRAPPFRFLGSGSRLLSIGE